MKKLLVLPFLMSSFVLASSLNLEVTDSTLAVNAELSVPENENFALRATYLYNDNSGKDNYYSIGLQAEGQNALDSYNTKLKIFVDFDHTKDNSAIPIGVGIVNNNFGNTDYPLFGSVEVAFAPKILSFDNAERLFKFKAEVGVQPIENAKAFIGYKKISFNSSYLSVGYVGIGFVF